MRKFMENVREKRKFAQLLHFLFVIFVFSATYSLAQSAPQSPSGAQASQSKATVALSAYSHVNKLAALSRAGNTDATNQLAREPFNNAGIPIEIADAFGFTRRVAQAEIAYRKGIQAPVREADIVNAVNHFATTLGAPPWTQRTPAEIRKLRVRLFVVLPQLFANHEPPDAKGHYSLLSSNMSPLEASYIATTMLYMKVFNSDFQFTEAERTQNQHQDPAVTLATQRQREGQLLDIIQGRSNAVSVIDLMAASDQLFNDLGVRQETNSAKKAAPSQNTGMATVKGGL